MSISILVLRTFFRSLFGGVFAWVFHFGARPPPISIFNIEANICDRRAPQAREGREHLGLGSLSLCSVVVLGGIGVGISLSRPVAPEKYLQHRKQFS